MRVSDTATALAVVMPLTGVVVWRLRAVTRSVVTVDHHIRDVRTAVEALRRAHEDHVERVTRRLRDVEVAATAAQTEGRIVSGQLARHQAHLGELVDLIEDRHRPTEPDDGSQSNVDGLEMKP